MTKQYILRCPDACVRGHPHLYKQLTVQGRRPGWHSGPSLMEYIRRVVRLDRDLRAKTSRSPIKRRPPQMKPELSRNSLLRTFRRQRKSRLTHGKFVLMCQGTRMQI